MVAAAKPTNRMNGAALKTKPEVTPELVQLAIRSRFNPIRGLTPQLLATQLDNFNLGFISWTALTWDAIERRDDVLKGVASKRKKSVARLEWEILTIDDSAEAKQHQEALQEFYDNLTAVNALDENERGSFALLVRQMMDAVGKKYAVHEIVWQPGDVLTAELRFVPLWFFENRTGKLRFLKMIGGTDGEELDDGGWMVTAGDGLMEACSVAYMFKNLPLKDWLSYSDKFGTPGVLGMTNASKGSEAGDAMRDAVNSFGQNWSGTIYGADGAIAEPIKLIQAGQAGDLPFPPLIERMDRAMVSLWRGSDLSTMSADTKGASVQEDESDLILSDDAELIGESLNTQLSRKVLWQKFGAERGLAYIKLMVPRKKDLQTDVAVDTFLLGAGAKLGSRERCEYYGRPEPEAGDEPLTAPMAAVTEVSDQKSEVRRTTMANAAIDGDLEMYLGPLRDEFLQELSGDLQPLRSAMEAALQNDAPEVQRAKLISLRAILPLVLRQINASPKSAQALAEIMATAFAHGYQKKEDR